MIPEEAVRWTLGMRVQGYEVCQGAQDKRKTWVVVRVTPPAVGGGLQVDLMEEGDYTTHSSLPCGFHAVLRPGRFVSGMDFRSAMLRTIRITQCNAGTFPWEPYG